MVTILERNLLCILEVTKIWDLVVSVYFPLVLFFFLDSGLFEFWNTWVWSVGVEGKSVCFFKLISEVLGKKTSCNLSDLVDVHVVEHPINQLSRMELWLDFLFVPIICMVPTVFVSPSFLVSPNIIDCLVLFFRYYVGDLRRVEDGERNDCVVSVKVNVDRLICGYCLADKECKKQENDYEQVAKCNEVLVHRGLQMVQVVCFLRQRNVFKMR